MGAEAAAMTKWAKLVGRLLWGTCKFAAGFFIYFLGR
jgi:hypothetical protein